MPTAERRNKRFEMRARRRKVAELMRRRLPQAAIADALNTSEATISRDVKTIERQLEVDMKDEYLSYKREYLEELEFMKEQVWLAMSNEKSRRAFKDVLTGDEVEVVNLELFDELREIWKEIAKVIGLYAPEKHKIETEKPLAVHLDV